jgi:hypothetical protein
LAGQYRDLENGSVLLLQDSNGSSVFSGWSCWNNVGDQATYISVAI